MEHLDRRAGRRACTPVVCVQAEDLAHDAADECAVREDDDVLVGLRGEVGLLGARGFPQGVRGTRLRRGSGAAEFEAEGELGG